MIPSERLAEEDAIIELISRGERVPTFETIRLRKNGEPVDLAITVSPVRDAAGNVVAASKIARDIGDRKAVLARLEESERHFRLMADNIAQLAWIADSTGWITWYNERWFDYTGTTISEMQGWGWKAVHHPDHLDRVVERVQHSWDTGEDWEDTFPLRGRDGKYRWFLSRAVPLRADDGSVLCWFGTNTDITEMREAEQRIELLLQEVNHRSKNMLAVIQSLVRRSEPGRPDFIQRFEQRIRGIAANQDLLVSRAWSSVPVAQMIEAQLRFLNDMGAMVSRKGPDVLLKPSAAEALAMAMHEMATNAIKYGSLGVTAGKVEIRWSIDSEDGRDLFRMSWIEQGGPRPEVPDHSGFGSRIIVDVPRSKLGAKVKVDFPPQGFTWHLECPLDHVI